LTDVIDRRRPIVAGALALMLLAGACGGGSSESAAGEGDVDPVLNTEFVLFDSGQPATLADYGGTPLVVNLWASWCPNCISEMPDFEEVHQNLGDEVMFIGINVEDDRAKAEELREATGVTYLLGTDDEGRLAERLGAFSLPATVFITASGQLADIWIGQLDVDKLTAQIDEHLLVDGAGEDEPEEAEEEVADADTGVEAAAGTADDLFEDDFLRIGPGSGFVVLDDPVLIEASAATWIEPDDIVIGVVSADGSDVQAYPVNQMAYHHIANTSLAGEPFVVTY
jgi:thiol-disulfide isomerase/thioredoxin